MGTLEIICHNCGAVYEVTPDCVYPADTMEQKHIYPYRCPHCLSSMNPKLWEKVVHAFWTMEEANKDLREEAEQYARPLMQAQYKTHFVRKETVIM